MALSMTIKLERSMRAGKGFCAALLLAASTTALAQTPELTFGGYLAGSLRDLDSDFEPAEDSFEGTNNASHLNLKAALKSETLSGFLFYERGLRNDKAGIEPDRQLYLGLDTPYGRLTAGKKASAYREAGERVDPFYDTSVAGFNGRAMSEGASYGLSNLTNGFSKQGIAYTSPEILGGLQLNGGAFIGTKKSPNNKTDAAAGAVYTLKNLVGEGSLLSLGAQYLKIENGTAFALGNSRLNDRAPVGGTPGASDNVRVHGAFVTSRFSLGASFEHIDVKAEPKARGYLYVAATAALSPETRLAVNYGRLDFKTGSPALSGDGYGIGLFQKLNDNVNAYVAGRRVSLDGPGDSTSLAVGLSINFSTQLYPWAASAGGDE